MERLNRRSIMTTKLSELRGSDKHRLLIGDKTEINFGMQWAYLRKEQKVSFVRRRRSRCNPFIEHVPNSCGSARCKVRMMQLPKKTA